MKKYLLFTIIFFGTLQILFAQATTYTVSGTIIDKEVDEPLIGASVLLEGTTTGTSTDAYGQYKLELPSGSYQLAFSYTGYESQSIPIEIVDENITVDVQMEEGANVIFCFFTNPYRPELESIGTVHGYHLNRLSNFHNDQLQYIPGVSIDNSRGEIGRLFSRRGLGNEHFIFLEDGEAVTMAHRFSSFAASRISPDIFVRNNIEVGASGSNNTLSSTIDHNTAGTVFQYLYNFPRYDDERIVFQNQVGIQANGQEIYNKLGFRIFTFMDNNWELYMDGFVRYDGGNRPSDYGVSRLG